MKILFVNYSLENAYTQKELLKLCLSEFKKVIFVTNDLALSEKLPHLNNKLLHGRVSSKKVSEFTKYLIDWFKQSNIPTIDAFNVQIVTPFLKYGGFALNSDKQKLVQAVRKNITFFLEERNAIEADAQKLFKFISGNMDDDTVIIVPVCYFFTKAFNGMSCLKNSIINDKSSSIFAKLYNVFHYKSILLPDNKKSLPFVRIMFLLFILNFYGVDIESGKRGNFFENARNITDFRIFLDYIHCPTDEKLIAILGKLPS